VTLLDEDLYDVAVVNVHGPLQDVKGKLEQIVDVFTRIGCVEVGLDDDRPSPSRNPILSSAAFNKMQPAALNLVLGS
jgi:hypothetical protein